MGTVMVRIGRESHRALRELAEQTGEPMRALHALANEEYGRKRFLEGANEDFAALRADPEAWREEQQERGVWDTTLAVGLGGK